MRSWMLATARLHALSISGNKVAACLLRSFTVDATASGWGKNHSAENEVRE